MRTLSHNPTRRQAKENRRKSGVDIAIYREREDRDSAIAAEETARKSDTDAIRKSGVNSNVLTGAMMRANEIGTREMVTNSATGSIVASVGHFENPESENNLNQNANRAIGEGHIKANGGVRWYHMRDNDIPSAKIAGINGSKVSNLNDIPGKLTRVGIASETITFEEIKPGTIGRQRLDEQNILNWLDGIYRRI